MVKNSGLLAFRVLAEAFDPDPSQPEKSSAIAERAATENHSGQRFGVRAGRIMADSSFPALPSIAPVPSYKRPGPDDKPIGWTGNCVPHPESPKGSRHRAYKHTR